MPHCVDQEVCGLRVQLHSLGERGGDLGTDFGVLSTVTLTDIVEEGGETEQPGPVQLDSDIAERTFIRQDRPHLSHGAPEVCGDRVLVKRLELGQAGHDAPLREHIREVSSLPEAVEDASPTFTGLQKPVEIVDRWRRVGFDRLIRTGEAGPDPPTGRHWSVFQDLRPFTFGETVYRLHGGDQVARRLECVAPEPASDRLSQFGREHIVRPAGHGMKRIANPEEDLERLFLLLLMLRGELADQVLAPTLPSKALHRPQTASAGFDIDGHQPIRSFGAPASLGFHEVAAKGTRPCHPGDGLHEPLEQLFGAGNETTGQKRCLGVESLGQHPRLPGPCARSGRPGAWRPIEGEKVRCGGRRVPGVMEEHQVDVGVRAELAPAVPAEGDYRHRRCSWSNQT